MINITSSLKVTSKVSDKTRSLIFLFAEICKNKYSYSRISIKDIILDDFTFIFKIDVQIYFVGISIERDKRRHCVLLKI